MRRLIDAYEVARILDCHYRTVHDLRKAGLLRAVRKGPQANRGKYVFDPRDVEAYIEAQKTEGVVA